MNKNYFALSLLIASLVLGGQYAFTEPPSAGVPGLPPSGDGPELPPPADPVPEPHPATTIATKAATRTGWARMKPPIPPAQHWDLGPYSTITGQTSASPVGEEAGARSQAAAAEGRYQRRWRRVIQSMSASIPTAKPARSSTATKAASWWNVRDWKRMK